MRPGLAFACGLAAGAATGPLIGNIGAGIAIGAFAGAAFAAALRASGGLAADASTGGEPWFERPSNYSNAVPIHPRGWRMIWTYMAALVLSLLLPLAVLTGAMHALGLTAPRPLGGVGVSAPLWPVGLLMAAWLFSVMLPMTLALMRASRARTRLIDPADRPPWT